ncbi:uncharacterized protein LOC122297617 [Carya illinoinensis]|uniref:uncharacterized protein LOC122297617 n=1 Tax=Carya illinoinensis TaxID=32201 RepID=UPI001C71E9E0|nr:uncharacterized protein LOC122297617 [Carya illinoinensis]
MALSARPEGENLLAPSKIVRDDTSGGGSSTSAYSQAEATAQMANCLKNWLSEGINDLFFWQGINDLAAWIVANHAHLEEVRGRRQLCYIAKCALESWRTDRVKLAALVEDREELKILLEQSESYSHSLQGDLEIREAELLWQHEAACLANEAKAKANFASSILLSERDSTRLQLLEAQESLKAESSRLAAHDEALSSLRADLAHSQDSCRSSKESLREANLALGASQRSLFKKEGELIATREEVAWLRDQLAHVRATRDDAFAFGYGSDIRRLRDHLLADPAAKLRILDQNLFYPEETSLRVVDEFGRKEMPDVFANVPRAF